jgi:hypothetical protein
MKARTTASVVAALLAVGACQNEGEWRVTDCQQSSLRDTLLIAAQQPQAYPGADVSATGCYWVHPEVALLIGTLKIPSPKGDTVGSTSTWDPPYKVPPRAAPEGDTTRFTSTMVFILTEEGWELKWSQGVFEPD